jgi:hypothetical protein
LPQPLGILPLGVLPLGWLPLGVLPLGWLPAPLFFGKTTTRTTAISTARHTPIHIYHFVSDII